MATIVAKRGKTGTTYKVVIRMAGQPLNVRTFKSKTIAKEWARQEEHRMRSGEFVDLAKEARSHTVQELFEKYRERALPAKSLSTARLEDTVLRWWEARIGAYALANITPEMLSDYLHELSLEGDQRYKDATERPPKKKARQTLKHYRDTLQRVFKMAIQLKWTGVNPLIQVPPITKVNNQRARFLDETEIKALLKECRNSNSSYLYAIVVFALSTGARKGEILNLTLRDIDLERNTAVFRHTKNGERRTVPISNHLKSILAPHLEQVRGFYEDIESETQWLFPSLDGQFPVDIYTAWYNALEDAGIDDFRFHDLRHTAASYLAMNGATLLEIAAVLGHKTLQMVKRYSHISEQHTAEIVEKMNEKLFTTAE